MGENQNGKEIDDIAGDFVADMGDSALDLFQNERGVYLLASLALSEVLNKAPLRQTGVTTSSCEHVCRKATVH